MDLLTIETASIVMHIFDHSFLRLHRVMNSKFTEGVKVIVVDSQE